MLVHGGMTQDGRPRGDLWAYGVLPQEGRRGTAGVAAAAAEAEEEEEGRHVAAGMLEGGVAPAAEGQAVGQERPWERGGGGAAWRGAAWRLVRPARGSAVPPPRAAHASAVWGEVTLTLTLTLTQSQP